MRDRNSLKTVLIGTSVVVRDIQVTPGVFTQGGCVCHPEGFDSSVLKHQPLSQRVFVA